MTVRTSITADDMLAALKKWGITPKFYKADWRTHNRNSVQDWGLLNGFVVHNFASDISDTSSLDYLYRGDSARQLPGPLSQFAITDDGSVWVIGWGVANHCKSVDNPTHALVLKNAMPRDRDIVPKTSGNDSASLWVPGNNHYIGVEMTYGNRGPTPAQRSSCALLAAAMMDMLGGVKGGYTGGSVIGHREATTTRSDPQQMPMGPFRKQVDELLRAGVDSPAPAPAPTPSAPKPGVTTTFTASTLSVAGGQEVRLTASVSPATAGIIVFDWADPATPTEWNRSSQHAVSAASSKVTVSKVPSKTALWRAGFDPTDPALRNGNYSAPRRIEVVNLGMLAADVAAIKKKLGL